jgi:nickel transport protein
VAVIRFSLAVVLTLLVPAAALAHAMDFECRLQGGKLWIEAYFEDDAPAQQALVRVLDAEQREAIRGKTDADGKWSCAAPPPGRYRVIVDAGAGHRAEHPITVPETNSSEQRVSLGGARAEHTQFPWLKAALGVGTIAGLSLAFLLARNMSRGRH